MIVRIVSATIAWTAFLEVSGRSSAAFSSTSSQNVQRCARWRPAICSDVPAVLNSDNPPTDHKSSPPYAECTSRRLLLARSTAFVSGLSLYGTAANAVGATFRQSTQSTGPQYISPNEARITNKVYLNVRISRQDGTFCVRDDLDESIPENRVFSCRLVVGLFGKAAPEHVQRFLNYVQPQNDDDVDNPLPSYARSTFPRFDDANGLLWGGNIPGLEYSEFNGNPTLQYNGRLLPARLWKEDAALPRILHNTKGLLTHDRLDTLPQFGLTTRSDSRQLDRSHTVFGQLVLDDDARAFLALVQDLPTYAVDRAPTSSYNNDGDSVVQTAAQQLFNAQQQFFRHTATSLGDTRVGKLYEGKLLRRIEVTQVGLL